MLNITETVLRGVYLLQPRRFCDHRGWLTELYSQRSWEQTGLPTHFVQDNLSFSLKQHTLRGFHLQKGEKAQGKLIYCPAGKILDVAVDLRPGSPQYLQWVSCVLSAENLCGLYVPKGFAHGFLTLEDHTCVFYKLDEFYSSEQELTIRYDDPAIRFPWGVEHPIVSERDKTAPSLHQILEEAAI